MTFSETISLWIDQDNLVGTSANPGRYSGGNQILETSLAVVYEILLQGKAADLILIRRLLAGIRGCQKPDGIFNKNPGRPDEITHDDLKAAASLQRLAGVSFATALVRFGEANGWVLTNTGKPYFEALCKPWDIAFYQLAAGVRPAFYNHLALVVMVSLSAFSLLVGNHHPSDDRLMWLNLKAIAGMSVGVDLAASLWRTVATRKYQSVGNLMGEYYNQQMHPYAQYGQELVF